MSRLNVDQIYTRTGTGSPAIREMPYFRVYRTTNQTLTPATFEKVEYDEVDVDTNGWWDAVNYKWTPQIAGYYCCAATLHLTGSTAITRRIGLVRFSSGVDIRFFDTSDTTGVFIQTGGGVGYFNGTTDSVHVEAYTAATSPIVTGVANGQYARFEGFLVRPD